MTKIFPKLTTNAEDNDCQLEYVWRSVKDDNWKDVNVLKHIAYVVSVKRRMIFVMGVVAVHLRARHQALQLQLVHLLALQLVLHLARHPFRHLTLHLARHLVCHLARHLALHIELQLALHLARRFLRAR